MPRWAEVVERAELSVIEANDGAIGVLAERTDSGPDSGVLMTVFRIGFVIAHVAGESAVGVVHQGVCPIAGLSESLGSCEFVRGTEATVAFDSMCLKVESRMSAQ